jgi:hypothetical protein
MNGHRCPSIPQGERLSVQFAKLFLRKLLGLRHSARIANTPVHTNGVLLSPTITSPQPGHPKKLKKGIVDGA